MYYWDNINDKWIEKIDKFQQSIIYIYLVLYFVSIGHLFLI